MSRRPILSAAFLAVLFLAPLQADAHFLWLSTSEDGKQLEVFFSEEAQAEDAAMLKYMKGVVVRRLTPGAQPQVVETKSGEASLVSMLKPGVAKDSLFVLQHDFGVISRGGATFLLRYYAKTGPAVAGKVWKDVDAGKHLPLDLKPASTEESDGKVRIQVLWRGKPAAGSEVKIAGPGMDDVDAKVDKSGHVAFTPADAGVYSIRARHIESKAGESDGKKYETIRHYSTLALRLPAKNSGDAPAAKSAALPEFPQPVTSFGAAIAGDYVYTYGGHMGEAHTYSVEGQSNVLRRLNLESPKEWETVSKGPKLQGLAMVSYKGKLYRVGGFTAKNQPGEERSLWSQADVSCFDPETKTWSKLPPLPKPRSSHDAALVGGKLYVVGGWELQGDKESKWHEDALVMDLDAESPSWETLPKPPFQRRALALAAFDGKLYVAGGMQQKGKPTTRVDVYDPAAKKWSQAPGLNGEPMEGFGCSAFAVDGRLYVSTIRGNLQQLSEKADAWKTVQKLERARFFHRMLPVQTGRLLFVGGANMGVGKFSEVDVVDVK